MKWEESRRRNHLHLYTDLHLTNIMDSRLMFPSTLQGDQEGLAIIDNQGHPSTTDHQYC